MANSANTAAESPVFFEENDNEIADVDPDMMYFINKTEFNSSVQKWKKVSNFVLFVMKKIEPVENLRGFSDFLFYFISKK